MHLTTIYNLCRQDPSVLKNTTLQAAQCVANTGLGNNYTCIICPNTDLAGVGVRAAFYAQSLFNTLLVVFSPGDSIPSAWAGSLLTAALVIAAFVQKRQATISLHHATLILNYATLSCISSLATAPMLPIWRFAPPDREVSNDARRDALHPVILHRHKKESAKNKQRVVLAFALLTQVVLQWAWGLVMFVSQTYSQEACNGTTVLLFFFVPLTALDINHGKFFVWVLWLLFCLGITLYFTVALAVFGGTSAYNGLSRRSTITSSDTQSVNIPLYKQLYDALTASFPSWRDRRKQLFFWGNICAVCLWISYIILSELQIQANCIFAGEEDFGGFGQITAVFLAFTPIWTLIIALRRYPSELRIARRYRQSIEHAEGRTLLPLRADPPRQAHPSHGNIRGRAFVHSVWRTVVHGRRSHSVPSASSPNQDRLLDLNVMPAPREYIALQ